MFIMACRIGYVNCIQQKKRDSHKIAPARLVFSSTTARIRTLSTPKDRCLKIAAHGEELKVETKEGE